jgi:hypothetical protein
MGTIVLLPGGFKPPHAGHLQLARAFASNPKVDEVRMLIGPSIRDGITREQSMVALKALLANDPKIKVIAVDSDNPMVAAYDTVMNLPKNDTGTYALAASSKGEDFARMQQFAKSIEQYKTKTTKDGKSAPKGVKVDTSLKVDVSPLVYKGRTDDKNGQGISASIMRKDLLNKDIKNFATNYPGTDKATIEKLYNLFSKTVKASEKKAKKSMKEGKISLASILLTEGGTGGHMAHPFDLPTVNTGNDLVKTFIYAVKSLQKNPASVKIDGVNASVRLVDLDGKKQFVMDRGSNKPLDVKGITKADLEDRFAPGHGMVKIGGEVLDIFNESLPSIQSELSKLGLLDNPNILLNIEYVSGKTNVQDYGKNFLAIHGLLEIQQVTEKRRAAKEISYDKKALESMIKKMAPVAKEYDFEIYGSIPATIDKEPNFSSELSKSYTVFYTKNKKETKSLKDWLKTTKIPKDVKITLKDGKKVDALSKQVFVAIKNGTPLDQLVANKNEYKSAIDGFVTYLATMQLGDSVLKAMESPLGAVEDQEGVVIRDKSIYDKPFKITGSFILRGLGTSF